jgi:hypothetical protein
MTLFMISFPLMVLAVTLAVLPLILMSHADHRRRATEAISRHAIPSTRHSSNADIY